MNRALFFVLGVLAAVAGYGLVLAFGDGAPGTFIARAGDVTDSDTGWRVAVDAETGRHSVAHGTFSMNPPWPMKSGWFVFLENADRAWSFNGDDQLVVFVSGSGSNGGVFTVDVAPARVPEAVVRRVGELRVRAIADAARASRERLGL